MLLALHFAFAVSPAFERAGEIRLGTHAEQHGRTHATAHDDSTCLLCSVRTLAVVAPLVAPVYTMTSGRGQVVTKAEVESGVESGPGQHSRAPPGLS